MTPAPPKMSEKYLTDDELAALLRITIARLRNKISAGEPLPPYILPPGCRNRLWHADQVNDWLNQFTIGGNEALRDHPINTRMTSKVQRNRASRRRSNTLVRL